MRSIRVIIPSLLLALLAPLLVVPGAAVAQLCSEDGVLVEPGTRVVVTLGTAGDTITGEFAGCEGTSAIVEHDVLGRLTLAPDTITGTRPLVAACPAGPDLEVGAKVAVRLESTGDILTGEYGGCEGQVMLFTDDSLGELRLPAEKVASVAVVPIGQPAIAGTDLAVLQTPPPPLWKREVSFGFDGAQGNTERNSIRFEVRGDRENEKGKLALLANFRRASDSGDTSEERATASAKYDWKFSHPWSLFSQVRLDYDKFKNYDWRWSFTTGPAYRFITAPPTGLLGRIGVGASQDVGGFQFVEVDPGPPPVNQKVSFQDGIRPELNIGADFDHAFSDVQTLTINVDVYPELSQLGEYRLIAKAEWAHAVSKRWNLDLRFGVEDRYDSDVSPGTKENDLEYYGALVKSW